MSNGSMQTQPGAAPGVPPVMMPSSDHPIVNVNFGLSWKQITAAFAGLALTISGAIGSGALFMPAKESDLQSIRQIVEMMRGEQERNRDAISRLTLAVDNLSGIVNGMKVTASPITKARR